MKKGITTILIIWILGMFIECCMEGFSSINFTDKELTQFIEKCACKGGKNSIKGFSYDWLSCQNDIQIFRNLYIPGYRVLHGKRISFTQTKIIKEKLKKCNNKLR